MCYSMLQDAPDTIEKVLRSEQDLSTRRNAFSMLANHAQDKAVRYLFENLVSSTGLYMRGKFVHRMPVSAILSPPFLPYSAPLA